MTTIIIKKKHLLMDLKNLPKIIMYLLYGWEKIISMPIKY